MKGILSSEEQPVLYPLMVPPNPSVGDSIEIVCTIKRGSLPIKFSWFYDGVEVSNEKKKKITIGDRSSHFSVGNIRASDIGNYTCVASNKFGTDSKTQSVIVEVNGQSDKPVLNPILVPPNLSLGDMTEIVCAVRRGKLPVSFHWLHNGKEISSHGKYKISSTESSSNFNIGQIQATDIGNYTCVANNRYGEDKVTISLVIEGVPEEPPVLNPMFVPPNLAIGDNVELLCIIKRGSYPVQIKWLHNGNEIKSLQKFKIMNSDSSSHLSIGKIQASDIGNYTCFAKNSYGQDSFTVQLVIEGDTTNIPPVLNPMFVPPNLALGDITEMFCIIKRGSFPVTFKWYHNGVNLNGKQKYKIINSESSSHLSIGKIQASDIGNYTCVVTNRFGKDSGTVNVIIEGKK
ncbi:titin-like [Stegodyphus dumicola]|uniref:titin-like n=1 Tax=Stegodyphus dumicola TaxID=202533 RepID=UPI0015B04CE4|nr:titin-like [Stegodyphus dumicola]